MGFEPTSSYPVTLLTVRSGGGYGRIISVAKVGFEPTSFGCATDALSAELQSPTVILDQRQPTVVDGLVHLCVPRRIRTHGLLFRRQALYPTEL